MKLTLQIQLLPDKQQADQLKSTMERFNSACSWLAEQAFELKTANKITLQQHFYYDLREKFGLSSQMAALCIRHVGGTYSRDKSVLPVFRPNAAMPYDSRILSSSPTPCASAVCVFRVPPLRLPADGRGDVCPVRVGPA